MRRGDPRLGKARLGIVGIMNIQPNREHTVQRVTAPSDRRGDDRGTSRCRLAPPASDGRAPSRTACPTGSTGESRSSRRRPSARSKSSGDLHALDVQVDRRQITIAQRRKVATHGAERRSSSSPQAASSNGSSSAARRVRPKRHRGSDRPCPARRRAESGNRNCRTHRS